MMHDQIYLRYVPLYVTFQNSAFCCNGVYVCVCVCVCVFHMILKISILISLKSITGLVPLVKMELVLCQVGTEFLCIVEMKLRHENTLVWIRKTN